MIKVIGVGRLATDPVIRTTQNGTKSASYRIAVWRDKNNTDFYSCTAWRNNAEFAEKWMHKGTAILFDGHLEPNEYTGKDGTKHTDVRIIIDNTEFVGGRANGESTQTKELAPADNSFVEVKEDGNLPF